MSPELSRRASFRGALFVWASRWAGAGLVAAMAIYAPLAAGDGPAGEPATIKHVIDGDTVILTDERHVRLIGINTPELGRKGKPDQPLAREARQALADMVRGGKVRLQYDLDRHDRHDRTLAYLETRRGEDVQAGLLRKGLAWFIAIPDNTARLAQYRRLEQEARKARLGIWNHPQLREPVPADRLGWEHKGFTRVLGKIEKAYLGKKNVYLRMHRNFAIQVRRSDWNRYFKVDLKNYRDKTVVVRGWVNVRQDGRMLVRIQHPAMIETLNPDQVRNQLTPNTIKLNRTLN